MDFLNNFNTQLSDEQEIAFQNWLVENIQKYGIDISNDLESYDLRGFWLNGGDKDEAFRQRKGHAPDTYKKPNHPTFSVESIYNSDLYPGGTWKIVDGEEVFIPPKKEKKKAKSTTMPAFKIRNKK